MVVWVAVREVWDQRKRASTMPAKDGRKANPVVMSRGAGLDRAVLWGSEYRMAEEKKESGRTAQERWAHQVQLRLKSMN